MMDETFTDDSLKLHLFETADAVRLEWSGMSMARDPGKFLAPILSRALDTGLQSSKPLVVDFKTLEYLNSSTITPIIRLLEHARRSRSAVTIVYDRSLKWQALSFTALELFRTPDGRIEVRGE